MAPKQYTLDEVAGHNTEKDIWLIIGNEKTGGPKVYDVTKYLEEHPGGSEVLLDHAGKYADEMFEDIGHSGDAKEKLKTLLVGELTPEDVEKLASEKVSRASELPSKGGLNPFAVVVLLVAIVLGLYLSKQYKQ
ncbi:cytochrome b5 [Nannochloropsis oceanica]